MYLSATISILLGEVILQFFAGYYMGIGVNYARRQKFFLEGHLVGSWYATQAKIMYARSILWLAAVPLAIVACLWSVLGVSEIIWWLNADWIEVKKTAKEHTDTGSEEQEKLLGLKIWMKIEGQEPWQQETGRLQNDLSTAIDSAFMEWDELNAMWKTLYTELQNEQKERRLIERKLKRATDRLKGLQEGTREMQERYQAKETAQEAKSANDWAWYTGTPTGKRTEAHEHFTKIGTQLVSNERQRAEVETLLATCERDIQRQILRTIVDSWDELLRRQATLRQDWAAYADEWRLIAEKRSEDPLNPPRVNHLSYVVIFPMLLCWIAQWLWWAGFVGVAGDKYCPPTQWLLGLIWTIFDSIGTSHIPAP